MSVFGTRKKLYRIVIPKYIRKVKISNKVRPKYWEWDGITIKSKSKKLLQKYINPEMKREVILNDGNVLPQHLKKEYTIGAFYGNKCKGIIREDNTTYKLIASLTGKEIQTESKNYLIFKDTFERVIANPNKVGLPNYHIINGQNIYNHTANPFTTGKVFNTIKQMYYDRFNMVHNDALDLFRSTLDNHYPLEIEVEVHDTVKNIFDNTKRGNGRRWDVGNRTDPYMKTFLDFLVCGLHNIEPFIIDDDRLHVTTGNNSYFIPIEDEKNRKLVFNIYQNTNPIFKQYLENENI